MPAGIILQTTQIVNNLDYSSQDWLPGVKLLATSCLIFPGGRIQSTGICLLFNLINKAHNKAWFCIFSILFANFAVWLWQKQIHSQSLLHQLCLGSRSAVVLIVDQWEFKHIEVSEGVTVGNIHCWVTEENCCSFESELFATLYGEFAYSPYESVSCLD